MRPHEFAKEIGVSVETLRRWDRTGKLKAKRTPSNHRYYTEDLIEQLLTKRGCQIVVANTESLSPQAELLEDLMAVVHCFSCRLYGARSYRKDKEKAIRKILNIPSETLLKLQNKIQC